MDNEKHHSRTLTVVNELSESSKLSSFLAQYISANSLPADIQNDLRSAAEEIFVNIVNYAFSNNESCNISIEITNIDNTVSLTFIDSGIKFNPLSMPGIDTSKTADTDAYCDGGMGIHLIKSLTDHQQYSRINHHNIFTVSKRYKR